jgi:hypothetical protein
MKLAFWKKEEKVDPFDEKEIGKYIKSEVEQELKPEHVREIQALNQLAAYDELAKRVRTRKREPFSRWLPPKVDIAWFDRNFSVLHIRQMNWIGDGLISDSWWGRAADVLGPNAWPITISVKGKTSTGFIVDGDKGVGINIERDDTKKFIDPLSGRAHTYATLGSTSEIIFSIVNSKKIAEQFGSPITTRMLFITCAIIAVMAFLMGHSWK